MEYGICTTYHTDRHHNHNQSFALVYPMYRDSLKMCKKMFSQKNQSLCGLNTDQEPGTFIVHKSK